MELMVSDLKLIILLVVISSLFLTSSGRIREIRLPSDYQGCFDQMGRRTTLQQTAGGLINWECIQKCLSMSGYYHPGSASDVNEDWFAGLLRTITPSSGCSRRRGPLRERKEIRRLKRHERWRYFRAVRRLKRTKYGNTTRYDFIASLHTGDNVILAHFGPNFLPWHRLYVLLFEEALRQIDSGVVLPYWDVTLDSELLNVNGNPADSVLWSPKFFGSGSGEVIDGPFRNWTTSEGNLVRNIGEAADLILNKTRIETILTQTLLGNISSPTADLEYNVEFWHRFPHLFIGGQMRGLNTAAFEPVFFMYHCFIDYVFERFQQKAKAAGVDTQRDWPDLNITEQAYGATFGLGNLTNIQGRSDYFTLCVYRYEPSPTCTINNLSCGSRFLRCNATRSQPVCVAKTRSEVERSFRNSCHKTGNYNGLQNSFCCNGTCSSKEWVYIPVDVVQYRPPEYHTFTSLPVVDNKVVHNRDIYVSDEVNDLRPSASASSLATYGICDMNDPHDVIIETTGLNYVGSYQEIAIADSRLPLSRTTVYIAVKNPEKEDTRVLISASDSCGRICTIFCREHIFYDYFHPCSGSLRITPDTPKQYGYSIEDIIEKTWSIPKSGCPSITSEDVFIRILCNYSSDWIWNATTASNS